MNTGFCSLWVGDSKSKSCRDCQTRNPNDSRALKCERYWMKVVAAAKPDLLIYNPPHQLFSLHLKDRQRDDRKVYLSFDKSDLAVGKEDFEYCRVTGKGRARGIGAYHRWPDCSPSGARLQPYVDKICQRVIGAPVDRGL